MNHNAKDVQRGRPNDSLTAMNSHANADGLGEASLLAELRNRLLHGEGRIAARIAWSSTEVGAPKTATIPSPNLWIVIPP